MRVVQRLGLLAGIALIAALIALAAVRQFGGEPSPSDPKISAEPAPGGSWSEVRAGVLRETAEGQTTACGVTVGAKTDGVAHPSLPCGARIFIAYENTEVLTRVIERGPYVPGRDLDLAPGLAAKLGIEETTEVRWAFAR